VTLIVRSGLHAGASLELSQEAYVIGADADCDIVLRDSGIAPRHCRVTRNARGVSVWDIRPGSARVLRPLAAARESSESGGRDEALPIYEVGAAHIAFRLASQERAADRSAAASPESRIIRKRSPAHIAATALLIILVLATLVIAAAGQIAAHMRPGIAERLAQGDAALMAQGFNTVHFRSVKQNELELAGTVPSAAEKKRLRTWIANSTYKDARFKIHAADALVQQVRDALGDGSVRVRFDRGRLLIEGTTSRLSTRQRIRSVTEDLKGVIAIDDRVAYVESAEAPGPLPVRVRDVKVGDARYFSTDNGDRYFEGAVLPDGAEVVAIEATQIRFRRNGQMLVYEWGLGSGAERIGLD
jgi:type III secretion protein D